MEPLSILWVSVFFPLLNFGKIHIGFRVWIQFYTTKTAFVEDKKSANDLRLWIPSLLLQIKSLSMKRIIILSNIIVKSLILYLFLTLLFSSLLQGEWLFSCRCQTSSRTYCDYLNPLTKIMRPSILFEKWRFITIYFFS